MKSLSSLILLSLGLHLAAAEFESLFNGKDLSDWKGDPELWSVENGVIVGRTTAEKPIPQNTFLIWEGDEPADFEFTAKVRFKGNNSGVQYRSKKLEGREFGLSGYQMDLHPNQDYFGMLYGESYDQRGIIATRGQKLEFNAKGESKVVGKIGDENRKFSDWEWNDIRIRAVGPHLIHQVNGITTVDITDHHSSARTKGLIGLQLHQGKPMRVEFKDLKLRRLDKPKDPKQSALPAFMKTLEVPDGFEVDLVYQVPRDRQGSWVSLTKDDRGRFLASDQWGNGVFRITVAEDSSDGQPMIERLPARISACQGLEWKDGKLYAFRAGRGIFQVWDGDGDDQLEHLEMISRVTGGAEHGNHALFDPGEPDVLFAIAGNHTPLPPEDQITRRRVPSWGEDLLLPRQWDPRGHAQGIEAPGGWVTKFHPQLKTHELYAIGFRNAYDLAITPQGELFTFDSDMEWDFGLPWYRPTRICHVVSGADFGWRSGTGKWPTYYEDSLPPVVDIGPGSPTGMLAGTNLRFPTRYRQAIFALDWTFGRILSIHLKPDGASFRAESELFLKGEPLAVTDAAAGDDGALYFTVGGRGSQSSLLRVRYTGSESTAAPKPEPPTPEALTRRTLEAFHGVTDSSAVDSAWPHLASSDRFLRHAARVAIESQPVDSWAERVFREASPQARIAGAVALARSGRDEHREPLLNCLLALDFGSLDKSLQLGLLRACSLAFERLGKPTEAERLAWVNALDPHFPARDDDLNAELLKVMVYLNAPSAVPKGIRLINSRSDPKVPSWGGLETRKSYEGQILERISKQPPPTPEIAYAFNLRNAHSAWTMELRKDYFRFLNEAAKAAGGACYDLYLENIRKDALALCSDEERVALENLSDEDFRQKPDFPIDPPKGPGRNWTVEEALKATEAPGNRTPVFAAGRSLFHAIGCASCHRLAGLGGAVGPDLTSVPNKFDRRYLLEAIIDPSKDISDQYSSSIVTLKDGRVLSGLVIDSGGDTLEVYPADPQSMGETVLRSAVESIAASPISQMPPALINSLNADELRDLVAYIMAGGDSESGVYK